MGAADKDLSQAIEENAAGPRSAQNDSGSVTEHALRDQIEADKYLQNKKALKKGVGLRLAKIIPGSTVGD